MIDLLAATEPATQSGAVSPVIIAAFVAAGLALIGTVIGTVLTYRLGRQNAAESRQTKERELEAASWVAQVENWRNDVVALRQQRAEDQAEYREHRAQCDARIEAQSKRLDEVLAALEEQRKGNRLLEIDHDALVLWSVQIIKIMQDHGIKFPQPPAMVAALIAWDPQVEEG